MKKAGKVLNRVLTFILVLIFVFAAYVFVNVLKAKKAGEVPELFGYSFLQVATGSMEPTIPTESLIVVHKTAPENVQVGDVICFYSEDPALNGYPNTHRVVEISEENGTVLFTTKGDASELTDTYPVHADRLIGVYQQYFQMEKALKVVRSNYFFFFALLVPLCVIALLEMLRIRKLADEREKKNARNEQE